MGEREKSKGRNGERTQRCDGTAGLPSEDAAALRGWAVPLCTPLCSPAGCFMSLVPSVNAAGTVRVQEYVASHPTMMCNYNAPIKSAIQNKCLWPPWSPDHRNHQHDPISPYHTMSMKGLPVLSDPGIGVLSLCCGWLFCVCRMVSSIPLVTQQHPSLVTITKNMSIIAKCPLEAKIPPPPPPH